MQEGERGIKKNPFPHTEGKSLQKHFGHTDFTVHADNSSDVNGSIGVALGKQTWKDVLREVLKWQGFKEQEALHIFCDAYFAIELFEKSSDGAIVAYVVVPSFHAGHSENKISDAQTSQVSCQTVTETSPYHPQRDRVCWERWAEASVCLKPLLLLISQPDGQRR